MVNVALRSGVPVFSYLWVSGFSNISEGVEPSVVGYFCLGNSEYYVGAGGGGKSRGGAGIN